jgi:arabinofuranosyltransferase
VTAASVPLRRSLPWMGAAAALAGAGFLVRAVALLYARHPHEDALILFRYVDHLAGGRGWVYNPDGPAVDGATDTLWVGLLAGPAALGVDVAVAAAAWGTLGAAAVAAIWARAWTRHRAGALEGGAAVLAGAALPLLPVVAAGYDGFSTPLFCAAVLGGWALATEGGPGAGRATPWVALGLAVFRPDGAVVGATLVGLALLRSAADRRAVVLHALAAGVAGAGFLAWRQWTFGSIVPLPLLVKSWGRGPLPGWDDQLAWLAAPGPAAAVMVAIGGVAALARLDPGAAARAAAGVAPVGALSAALAFAHLSQNVDHRFQAPVHAVLVATAAWASSELGRHRRGLGAAAAGATLLAVLAAVPGGRRVWDVEYIDAFAVRVGRIEGIRRVALTEAGRLPYWSDAEVFDVAGLNTPRTARRPATLDWLDRVDPDLVLFHAASAVDPARLRYLDPAGERVAERVDPTTLARAIRPRFAHLGGDLRSYDGLDVPTTRVASVVLARFLSERPGYDVFAVRYGGARDHLVAVRTGAPFTAAVIEALRAADDGSTITWAEAKGFTEGSLACRLVAAVGRAAGAAALGLPSEPRCRPGAR